MKRTRPRAAKESKDDKKSGVSSLEWKSAMRALNVHCSLGHRRRSMDSLQRRDKISNL